MLVLEARPEASHKMIYLAPVLAVGMTLLAGLVLFTILGSDPIIALKTFFIEPISTLDGLWQLLVKATPLVLIAVGLSFGFRANVWNIGAEGQLTVGALAASAVALAFYEVESPLILPAMFVAGALGGMAWGAIPAFLRTRFNTNEILSSLMLVYIALLTLSYLVHGPMKDPEGMNFPESRLFHDDALLPMMGDTSLHLGWIISVGLAVFAWLVISRHILGFQFRVLGLAPMAARYGGMSQKKLVWASFFIGGGAAGIAGMIEVAGPIGQLTPVISTSYGFTAIIVAFLGRLHPLGILLAGHLLALTYLGGEVAQVDLGLPSAVTGVFQGMLLFFLLASDVLIKYRIRFRRNVSRVEG
jgi:ABC-type uncharacterized transport system permease subunit